jgi:hypothetical protein
MGSTDLTHVQFSLYPQTYFRGPILSSHRLVFQDHNFLYVSLPKLYNRTYVSHVPTARISPRVLYFNTHKYDKSEQAFSLYDQVFEQMAW